MKREPNLEIVKIGLKEFFEWAIAGDDVIPYSTSEETGIAMQRLVDFYEGVLCPTYEEFSKMCELAMEDEKYPHDVNAYNALIQELYDARYFYENIATESNIDAKLANLKNEILDELKNSFILKDAR